MFLTRNLFLTFALFQIYQTVAQIVQFGTSGNDELYGVVADSSGNFVITGTTSGSFTGSTNSGNLDIFVRKFNISGAVAFTKQFGSSQNDYAGSIVFDSAGGIFVAGYTEGSLPGYTLRGELDGILRKYRSDGSVTFTKQMDGGFRSYDLIYLVSHISLPLSHNLYYYIPYPVPQAIVRIILAQS